MSGTQGRPEQPTDWTCAVAVYSIHRGGYTGSVACFGAPRDAGHTVPRHADEIPATAPISRRYRSRGWVSG
jgi:hypothetical protein